MKVNTHPVSFVVPMKNLERTIGKCLDSIINQDGNHRIEIVVVDDGSEDNSVQKVEENSRNSKVKIHLLHNLETHGRSAARNKGLEYVNSPYIAFVDSDVELPSDWLAKCVRILEKPDVACVCGRVYPDGFFSHISGLFHVPFIAKEPLGRIHGSNILCKREIIRKIGGFDVSFPDGEDVDLSFRLQQAGYEVIYTGEFTCLHRVQPSMAKLFERVYSQGKASTLLFFKHKTWRLQDVAFFAFLLVPFLFLLCQFWGPTLLLLIAILSIGTLAFAGGLFAMSNFKFKDKKEVFLPVMVLSSLLIIIYLIGRVSEVWKMLCARIQCGWAMLQKRKILNNY